MANDVRAQILQSVDIVELIGQTVSLKRAGKSYKGLCPFHQEKTPSFTVSPTKQTFYCFGCKASGTAFDFVMKRDRVEFRDALQTLAKVAGVELSAGSSAAARESATQRQALLDMQSQACRFFENLLSHESEGAAAREYLRGRGFNAEALKRFQVGLAADSWDALVAGPLGKKFGGELLFQGGLAKKRERDGGYYDTFRGRIMFPIRDEGSRIIAFGGRVMPGSQDPAKYLNSPETPIFAKSKTLFGLDLARQRIVETRTVAVVEGYTDVVMSHQFGASNVVSPLGTALTEQHVQVLRRFADRIVILFDADAAGDAAVDRVLQLFLTQPVEIAVASMPDGLDPDEFLVKYGLAEFDRLLAKATGALEYAWKRTAAELAEHPDDLTARQKVIERYLSLLGEARGSGAIDSLRWGQVLARVEKQTGLTVADLHRRFGRKPARSAPKLPPAAPEQHPDDPGAQSLLGDASASQPAAAEEEASPPSAVVDSERWILGVLLLEPSRWDGLQAKVSVDDFTNARRKRLASAYWDHQRDEGEPVFHEFLDSLGDPALVTLAIEITEEVERFTDLEARLNSAVEHLQDEKRRRMVAGQMAEIRRSDQELEQIELLKSLQQSARTPDLRRVGQ